MPLKTFALFPHKARKEYALNTLLLLLLLLFCFWALLLVLWDHPPFTPKQQDGSLRSISYRFVHVERDVYSKSMTHSDSLLVGTKIPSSTLCKDLQPDIHFPNPATLR